jgi:hypothetical protein
MRIDDLDVSGRGIETRYVARISDTADLENYELVIAGSRSLITEAFRDSNFDIAVDREPSQIWDQQLQEAREEELRSLTDFAVFQRGMSVLKPSPSDPTSTNAVVISLRRVGDGRTHYGPLVFSNFYVPMGSSFYYGLPPVCSCFGRLQPASGDQDLYLYRAWGWWNVGLAASIHGGTTPDVVSYTIPPLGGVCDWRNLFVPVFRIYGYQDGVCQEFRLEGQS